MAQSCNCSINISFLPSNWATTWKPPWNTKTNPSESAAMDLGHLPEWFASLLTFHPLHHVTIITMIWRVTPLQISYPGTENTEVPLSFSMSPRLLTLISPTHLSQNYVQIQCIWLQLRLWHCPAIPLYFNFQNFLKESSKILLNFIYFSAFILLAFHSSVNLPEAVSPLKSISPLGSSPFTPWGISPPLILYPQPYIFLQHQPSPKVPSRYLQQYYSPGCYGM